MRTTQELISIRNLLLPGFQGKFMDYPYFYDLLIYFKKDTIIAKIDIANDTYRVVLVHPDEPEELWRQEFYSRIDELKRKAGLSTDV
jgi:hypothetical protein